jgi:hypothetical protein
LSPLQEQSETMEVAAYTTKDSEFNLTGQEKPRALVGTQVTANLFTLLGVPAGMGHCFEIGEKTGPPATALSTQSRCGGTNSRVTRT